MKANQFIHDERGVGSVNVLIGVLVTILIFAALATVVADVVGDGGNLTGAALALYLLTPLFFVLIGILLILRFVRD